MAVTWLAIIWGLIRATSELEMFWRDLGTRLHNPATSIIAAIILVLLLRPFLNQPDLPGANAAAACRHLLWHVFQTTSLSLALLCSALLLCLPAAHPAGAIALGALLPYPLIMRIPAYQFLTVPLILLAWQMGAA